MEHRKGVRGKRERDEKERRAGLLDMRAHKMNPPTHAHTRRKRRESKADVETGNGWEEPRRQAGEGRHPGMQRAEAIAIHGSMWLQGDLHS